MAIYGQKSTGEKIKDAMKDAAMDIECLSIFTGIREDTLTRYIEGIKEADARALCRIAEVLDVDAKDLCADEDEYFIPVDKFTIALLLSLCYLHGRDLRDLVWEMLNNGIMKMRF